MKKSPYLLWVFVAILGLAFCGNAQAGSGTWDTDSPGNWTEITNWEGDAAYASDADSTATLGNYITVDRIINLDAPITIGNITVSDTDKNYTISGANILTLDRTDATAPTINVIPSGRTLTISSQIAGDDGLQKTGAGILSLSTNNTYTGGTVINAGHLSIAHNNALGTTAGNTTFAAGAGQLQLQKNIDDLSIGINSPEDITFFNSGTVIFNNSQRSSTFSGNITLDNPTGAISFNTSNGGSKITFSGTITQLGTSSDLTLNSPSSGGQGITVNNPIANNGGRLLIRGGSVIELKGVNATDDTGIGETVVLDSSANLRLGVSEALNTTANLTVNGTFNLNNFSQTVNALSGSGSVQNTIAGTKTLTVGNGGGTGSFNGVIQTGTGQVALTKTGAGTQTLTGVNTYSGPTLVNEGTLVGVVGGSCASSAVTNAGTLAISVTNNTMQWACASLTLNNGSQLTFNFTATRSPTLAPLVIPGNLTFSGTSTIEVVPATSGTYPLVTVTGTVLGAKPTVIGGIGALTWIGNTLWLIPSGTVIMFK